jgi:hypothetical protein
MVALASWLAALVVAQAPAAENAAAAAEKAELAAPSSTTPSSTPTPTSTSTSSTETPSPRESPPARPEPGAAEEAAGSRRASAPKPSPKPAPKPTAAARSGTLAPDPKAPRPVPAGPIPASEQVERAARAFLEALARGDANALAEASSDRFSFDGDVESGRDAVRRAWRSILTGRGGAAPKVSGVEVLSAAEAVSRLGKPPARIAPLAREGVWVAIGDVGGRPVVLFLGKVRGRLAVLGMHD